MRTDIVLLLDRSGSMKGKEEMILENLHRRISQIEEGMTLTVILFNNNIGTAFKAQTMDDLKGFELEEIRCNGMTNLYDSINSAIEILEEINPNPNEDDAFLIEVITDGQHTYTIDNDGPTIKRKIVEKENTNQWTFVYIGCDHDVFAQSEGIGVLSANSFAAADYKGTQDESFLGFENFKAMRKAGVTRSLNYFMPKE